MKNPFGEKPDQINKKDWMMAILALFAWAGLKWWAWIDYDRKKKEK